MTRLLVVALSAVGLILFVSLIVARLIRSRAKGLSIRMQFFLALGVIVGTFAFGLGLLVIDRVEARAVRLAQATASDEAETVAAILQSELRRTGVSLDDLAMDLGAHWRSSPTSGRKGGTALEATGLELLASDGRLLYPPHAQTRAAEAGAVFVDVPLLDAMSVVGTVRVVKPTIVVQALLADFAPTVLVISLLLGAVSAFAAAWIGRAIASPIEALIEFAQRVSLGERTALPAKVSGREVRSLVQSIDTMRRKLEGRPFVETFAADLSHELKNPVAAIRASAEVLEDGALDDPERARRFVARIREATERIEQLLAELLHLAHVETRGAAGLERLELGKLVRGVIAPLETAEKDRIEVEATGEVWTRGDASWVGRALKNLIDNALLHSPPGSRVDLGLRVQGPDVVVRVENEGKVAEHVRATLFKRFVTTRSDRGGTGLGLAIARAVAEAHGGDVETVEWGPPRVVLELRLPRA